MLSPTICFLQAMDQRKLVCNSSQIPSLRTEESGDVNLEQGQEKTCAPTHTDKQEEKEAEFCSFCFCSIQGFSG